MQKHKKWLPVLLAAILSFTIAACGQSGTSAPSEASGGETNTGSESPLVLDLSIPEPEGAKFDITAKAFKEELERVTDGKMSVKIYYNNAFGGEREVFEMMGLNSLDMGIISAGPMGNWVKEFNMFDLPFLFESREHAFAVLDGEIGDELAQKFEQAANVKILGWVENGFVATTSNKPIQTVDDVKGMKIRVQENEVQIDSWKAYGADPTPMAWPEVFTALQQGVIDGHSNSPATIQSSKIYEVQSSVALLDDRYAPAPIAISKALFESLTPEQQEAVLKAAEYAVPKGRQANQDKIDEAKAFLEEQGLTITQPDKESFKAKVDAVYEKWAPQIGQELIDKVRNFKY
ncbi:TRAP transporter substrate-binding protein DctP [Brevibacillus humidisoli]|uniref:TRAP transporter substrate-binding protein DctP n=1 Tax=Brevibacillus humidisoli TaxID=2895522 RepID=UPI001E5CA40E|nr:TRAP transporter substrate-binding protein DctP [Brevibacillus humidisoli]UFJ39916.1 TRAP transporter substrate-binding protein DctP [Brevibacillus humidisoli]